MPWKPSRSDKSERSEGIGGERGIRTLSRRAAGLVVAQECMWLHDFVAPIYRDALVKPT